MSAAAAVIAGDFAMREACGPAIDLSSLTG